MSNTANKPDETTLAFWRAAEAGEFGEVEATLSRVADVNARNEHGVTALMRAAQHGHARVVRLLLSQGADANVVRNDKFTALSLAAFFGHTQVVRVLMEHGADLKASTRHGTSPHMWATARTFNEVVDQLKDPAPPRDEERVTEIVSQVRQPSAPTTPLAPVAPGPVTSAIVRTFKGPPEIRDLVHEAPKGFNASAAFGGRLPSGSRGWLFRLATAGVLICATVIGVWVLRGVQARSEAAPAQRAKASPPAVQLQSEDKAFENGAVRAVATPAAAPSSFVVPPVSTVTREKVKTTSQRRRSHSSVAASWQLEREPTQREAAGESAERIQTQSETTDRRVQPQAVTNTKSRSSLSPQLMTPAKNAVSPRTKVIQWP